MTMAWYPHFMSDYESDTTHLSLMEHGAYRLLLDHYYKKRQPLPANASLLHRVCRAFAPDEQAAMQRVLDEFFVLKEDGYHQRRADKEIAKAAEISEKRAAAANVRYSKTNGLQRKRKAGTTSETTAKTGDANALQMHSKSTANALQMDTQLTTHINKERDPANAGANVFEQFKDLVEFKSGNNGSRQGASSFLSKMLGEYGRDEVERVAALAILNNAEDPKAYVRSILNGSAKKYMSQAEMNSAANRKLVY